MHSTRYVALSWLHVFPRKADGGMAARSSEAVRSSCEDLSRAVWARILEAAPMPVAVGRVPNFDIAVGGVPNVGVVDLSISTPSIVARNDPTVSDSVVPSQEDTVCDSFPNDKSTAAVSTEGVNVRGGSERTAEGLRGCHAIS